MRWVRVNEAGQRIGEDHPHAKLTEADVEAMLALRAQGWGWRRLAAAFEVHRQTVKRICLGLKRGQTVAGYRQAKG